MRPGGLLAVIEMESFPRFLPDDVGLGRPGLEERSHVAIDRGRAEQLFTVHLSPPLPAVTGRYAQVALQRMRAGLTGSMSAEDPATLDTLASSDGPDGVLRRDDLTVRTTRRAWVAKRP